MELSTPLLDPADDTNEVLMATIGIGTVWLFLGIALFWALGYEPTPLGFGTALTSAALPTLVTMGGHELAHYFVADEYCRYPTVDFGAFVSTTTMTLVSIAGALILVLLDVFGVVSLPKWLLLLGLVSPGAVIANGRSKVRQCMDETALAGPLWNFVVGIGLWWSVYGFQTPIPIVMGNFWSVTLGVTTVLSLGLAFVNSLPVGPLDGNKVWRAQEPITLTLWAVVLVGSAWFMTQPIHT